MLGYILVCGLVVLNINCADPVPTQKSPFSYYPEKDKEISYLGDGCVTVLTMPDQKVVVGPSLEYPIIMLRNSYKTLVAFKNPGASMRSLLDVAQKWFGADNLPNTRGFVYAHACDYETQDEKGMSVRTYHEGRTQHEELAFIEKELIRGLRLNANADEIKTHIFDDKSMHYDPRFPTAPVFLVVKHTHQGSHVFHVCPIVERLFDIPLMDNSNYNSVEDKVELLKEKLSQLRDSQNPYYKTVEYNPNGGEPYGSRSFVLVHFKKKWFL